MSGASEIASYNSVLLAGEESELLPPNLPFLQSLHVGMPKKLFVDGLQPLPDLINQSLSIDHGNLSFDHLIRPKKNRLRNRQADLLGRLESNDQLKLRWLLDWQIGCLGAFQDLIDVRSGAMKVLRQVRTIAQQSPSLHKFSVLGSRWKPIL